MKDRFNTIGVQATTVQCPRQIEQSIQYNTFSFIEDDKNKDRQVLADTPATETYYMLGINKIQNKVNQGKYNQCVFRLLI